MYQCTQLQIELTTLIENAGSDHVPTFGGRFEGGYHIQQNPAEFAELLSVLKGRSIMSYLQIGSAAGGAERLVCEYAGISDLTIIDDGLHPKFSIWTNINRPSIEARGVLVTQHIGNSHGHEAREFLEFRGKPFDLVGIDGDHTLAGVRADWTLTEPFLKPGTLVWFHDISSNLLPPEMQGSKEVWEEVSKRHKVILETFRHCGIGLLEII